MEFVKLGNKLVLLLNKIRLIWLQIEFHQVLNQSKSVAIAIKI